MFKLFSKNLFLFAVLGLALFVRLKEVDTFVGLSLSDGGRDVLVAKRIVEGLTSPWVAPWSSIPSLPNTSFYYWIISASYLYFGYMGPTWIHVISGVFTVFFVYKIVVRISGKEWLGLTTAFFAAFSDILTATAARPWQPNLELLFSSIALYFYLEGYFTKKVQYYWLTLLFTWFMLLLHNSSLPVVFILCVFLFTEYKEKLFFNSHEITQLKAWGSMAFFWVSWLLWAFLPTVGYIPFNLVSEISETSHIQVSVLRKFIGFIHFFPSFLIGWVGFGQHFWWKLLLFCVLLVVLVKNIFLGPLPRKIALLFLVIIGSFVTMAFVPGGNFRNWYFYSQLLFVFILVLLIPWLMVSEKKFWYIPQILFFIWWVPLVFFQPRYLSFIQSKPQPEKLHGFLESVAAADAIQKDVETKNISKDDFTVVVRKKADENNLFFSKLSWDSASVQLALELRDPQFLSRVNVVSQVDYWANIQEPDTDNYYVVCTGYGEKHLNCLKTLENFNKKVVSKQFLTNFESSENNSVAVYYFKAEKKD